MVMARGVTSLLEFLVVVVNKPFTDQCVTCMGEWLLSGNCQLTQTEIGEPSEALLGTGLRLH